MTTKFFALLVAALLLSGISFAKIFRIGYAGLPLTGVDFADFSSAQSIANAGDTIQIYGSSTVAATISKKLVIIGFGYNFDVNTGLQVIGTDAPSTISLTLGGGSDGTIVSGISGNFSIGDGMYVTPISNIIFQRCNGSFYFYNYNTSGAISNIKIVGCVVSYSQFYYAPPNDKPVTNLQFSNCIIAGMNLINAMGSTISVINCATPFGGYGLNLYNAGAVVKNCIIDQSFSSVNANTVYESCFFGETQPAVLPAGSNNRWSQDWGVIFNRAGGTDNNVGVPSQASFTENYYILKAGSPAINGGFNAANTATNCGIYGGEPAYFYKLSGVPDVPSIYKLTAPGTAASANPYNITISVRSNN